MDLRSNPRMDPASLLLRGTVLLLLLATLYPYNFSPPSENESVGSALLRTPAQGLHDRLDILANVLLFIPLGLGLARSRGLALLAGQSGAERPPFAFVILGGLLFSTGVELVQWLVPSRDPSLRDIATNVAGVGLGWLLNRLWGAGLLAALDRARARIASLHAAPALRVALLLNAAALLVLLFLPLPRATSFANWYEPFVFLLGNEQTGDGPWEGTLARVEVADRAISPEAVQRVVAAGGLSAAGVQPLVHFDFAAHPSTADRAGTVPELVWKGSGQKRFGPQGAILTRGPWLESKEYALALNRRLKQTSRLTLSVVCAPAHTRQVGPARIVSVSQDSIYRNFTLGQEQSDLVFRLRTPLTGENGMRPQLVVPAVFDSTEQRHIVVTYDGRTVRVFVDGRPSPHELRLRTRPGVALFSYVKYIVPDRPHRYDALYYLLLFLPLGLLLASAGLRAGGWTLAFALRGLGVSVLAAAALEIFLFVARGVPFSMVYVCMSLLIVGLTMTCLLPIRARRMTFRL